MRQKGTLLLNQLKMMNILKMKFPLPMAKAHS